MTSNIIQFPASPRAQQSVRAIGDNSRTPTSPREATAGGGHVTGTSASSLNVSSQNSAAGSTPAALFGDDEELDTQLELVTVEMARD